MYLNHFSLASRPFRIVPSPSMLYLSETHDEGRARILYGVRENRGFVVVTGAIGLGKTTVLMSVLEELESNLEVALVFNPVEEFPPLLRMICLEFGVAHDALDEVSLLLAFQRWLIEQHAQGKHCVLLIDEAQNLPLQVLEKLRMLSNLQTEETSLLQIVLVGQPELFQKLRDSRLVQLRQRIGVWHEIAPLGADDTTNYIHHRLKLAGSADPGSIFADGVCQVVHSITGGVPRLINQLCDTAMVIAYGANATRVGLADLRAAAEELRLATAPTRVGVPAGSQGAAPVPATAPQKVAVVEAAPAREARVAAASAPASKPVSADFEEADPHRRERPGVSRSAVPAPGATSRVSRITLVFVLLLLGALALNLARPEVRSAISSKLGEAQAASSSEQDSPLASTEPEALPTESSPLPAELSPASGPSPSPEYSLNVEQARTLMTGSQRLFVLHLASFRERQGAADYAKALLEQQPNWSRPLLIVDPPSEDDWFRVMTGPFPSSADARSWAGDLLRDGQVSYAQLATLTASHELELLGFDQDSSRGSK